MLIPNIFVFILNPQSLPTVSEIIIKRKRFSVRNDLGKHRILKIIEINELYKNKTGKHLNQ